MLTWHLRASPTIANDRQSNAYDNRHIRALSMNSTIANDRLSNAYHFETNRSSAVHMMPRPSYEHGARDSGTRSSPRHTTTVLARGSATSDVPFVSNTLQPAPQAKPVHVSTHDSGGDVVTGNHPRNCCSASFMVLPPTVSLSKPA